MADNMDYRNIISDINSNSIKKLYLFYGPELLLINDVILKVENKVINPAFKSLNYIKFDGASVTYDQIINACETLPFMDNRKLVIVKDCVFFKGKKPQDDGFNDAGNDEFCEYLSRIPETTVLILIGGDEIDKRKKIYGCIKKNGYTVEFAPLKGQDLINWVAKAFKNLGKMINKANASYLCERVSGSLEDMSAEINKISSYAGEKPEVSRMDIDAVVSIPLELNVFQLVDFITSKKPGRATSILNDMLLDGQAIPVILAMIIRQYRLLLNIKLLTEGGCSSSEILSKLGLRPFVLNNLSRISQRYGVKELEERLRQCLDTDVNIKTGKVDQRIAIESLIVKFAR